MTSTLRGCPRRRGPGGGSRSGRARPGRRCPAPAPARARRPGCEILVHGAHAGLGRRRGAGTRVESSGMSISHVCGARRWQIACRGPASAGRSDPAARPGARRGAQSRAGGDGRRHGARPRASSQAAQISSEISIRLRSGSRTYTERSRRRAPVRSTGPSTIGQPQARQVRDHRVERAVGDEAQVERAGHRQVRARLELAAALVQVDLLRAEDERACGRRRRSRAACRARACRSRRTPRGRSSSAPDGPDGRSRFLPSPFAASMRGRGGVRGVRGGSAGPPARPPRRYARAMERARPPCRRRRPRRRDRRRRARRRRGCRCRCRPRPRRRRSSRARRRGAGPAAPHRRRAAGAPLRRAVADARRRSPACCAGRRPAPGRPARARCRPARCT